MLGLVAALMCFLPMFQIGIYEVTWIAWSVLSPAFIPMIVGGLYWKRGTKEGAYAALVVGSVVGFGWYYLLQERTQIHTFFAALVLAVAAYIIVSLLTKKPPQSVDDMVDYAKKFEDTDTSAAADYGVQMTQEQFQTLIGAARQEEPVPAMA